MKEDLRSRLQGISGPVEGRNRIREYLQARILASLQRALIPKGAISTAVHLGVLNVGEGLVHSLAPQGGEI